VLWMLPDSTELLPVRIELRPYYLYAFSLIDYPKIL
jgi:hypothetical protein